MPHLHTNGVRLTYQRSGHGDSVLLIMGSGAAGHVWTIHQTPALQEAGYQTVTFNNRGVPPSDSPAGSYSLADMVADTRGLIEALGLAPCRIVGTSLGALIAQGLAIGSPKLVRCAVLIATKSRQDAIRRAQVAAERMLLGGAVRLPRSYDAVHTAMTMLSPTTLNNDDAVSSWLEILELAGGDDKVAAGQAWVEAPDDHPEALRTIAAPCRVIAFTDDLVAPPHLGAEVAEAIPAADFVEIRRCGHLGHLERPDEVNSAIIEFFDKY